LSGLYLGNYVALIVLAFAQRFAGALFFFFSINSLLVLKDKDNRPLKGQNFEIFFA